MRIALVSDCDLPTKNGVVTAVRQLAAALAERGHRVVLIVPGGRDCRYRRHRRRGGAGWGGEEKSRAARHARAVYHEEDSTRADRREGDGGLVIYRLPSLPVLPSVELRLGIMSSAAAERILRREEVELVHSHTEFTLARAVLRAARRIGIPCLHSLHTTYEQYLHYLPPARLLGGAGLERFWRSFLAGHQGVICPGERSQAFLRRCAPRNRSWIVPNGIDPGEVIPARAEARQEARRALGIEMEERVMIYGGRLAREKRSAALLEALIPLLQQDPRRRLLLAGGGPEEERLRRRAAAADLTGQVRVTGYLPRQELLRCCAAADFFITASLSENHPLSLVEAQMAGLPAAARRDVGSTAVIRQGETGLLADSDRQLAAAAERLLVDEQQRRHMGAAAAAAARGFGRERWAAQTEEIYRRLIEWKTRETDRPAEKNRLPAAESPLY